MEKESFFTGYCRALDAGRTVEVITEDGRLVEADCAWPGCIHAAVCPIAKEIEQLVTE